MGNAQGVNTDRGFTLTELLLVIAIVAILAGLLLPSLSRMKGKAHALTCMSNCRQLHLGWAQYITDNEDELPPVLGCRGGVLSDGASWVGGWLLTEFQSGDHSAGTNTLLLIGEQYATKGSIGIYVQNAKVYRCPGDQSGRVRSFSINCYLNGDGEWQDDNYITFRKSSEIRNPADTFVLLDEREDSINDGYFAMDLPALEKTGRYAVVDYPAAYHEGSATLSFADGHVERHRWMEETTVPPPRQGYHLPLGSKPTTSHDRDMKWLKDRATVRKVAKP